MLMICLYLKTHNKTGLKYLGKTTKDPFKYQGSGLYWTRHLKVHGNDVTTEILYESLDLDEIKRIGLEYSQKWSIVESKKFANLIPEYGTGGDTSMCFTEDVIRRMSEKSKSAWTSKRKKEWSDYKTGCVLSELHKKNISHSLQGRHVTDETRQKISIANKGKVRSEETRRKISESKRHISQETRNLISVANKGRVQTEETKEKIALTVGKYWTPEIRQAWGEKYKGRKFDEVQCPHCGKIGSKPAMTRWHFDSCKASPK